MTESPPSLPWKTIAVVLAVCAALTACESATEVERVEPRLSVVIRGAVQTPPCCSAEGWTISGTWAIGDELAGGPLVLDTTDASGSFCGEIGVTAGPERVQVVVTATSPEGDTLTSDLGEVELRTSSPDTVELVFRWEDEKALLEAYRVDAARLALRRARETGAEPGIEIPDTLRAFFLEALIAVQRLPHAARDSVVWVHAIHTFPNPELRDILVATWDGTPLAIAWAAGDTRAGVPAVDSLIDRYDMALKRFYDFGLGRPWAVLSAGRPLNAAALAARFRGLSGVRYADPDVAFGDGNDIRARESDDALLLDYSIGFGDCPAGCIHRHTWTFRVRGGTATFVGSVES